MSIDRMLHVFIHCDSELVFSGCDESLPRPTRIRQEGSLSLASPVVNVAGVQLAAIYIATSISLEMRHVLQSDPGHDAHHPRQYVAFAAKGGVSA
jgi:hypothetical protein